ncbi:MAG: hypothetical protein KGL39_14895 [Patescibacteria group bacterium]|nr:hypothetical protein [Patescibacteria group bacterium]
MPREKSLITMDILDEYIAVSEEFRRAGLSLIEAMRQMGKENEVRIIESKKVVDEINHKINGSI